MNKPKKVLFVTRDKKPGMIATRLAKELINQGAEVHVVAEGLSAAEWKSSGLPIYMDAEGPLDIKASWDSDPLEVLKTVGPDVLVVGLSSPMGKEEDFVHAMSATNLNKPVVALDDNWGATHRCKYPANLVLTIDALGKRLVYQHELYKDHRDDQVVIIGDLSATAASEPIPQATIDAFNAAKGDAEYTFILASQKWPESDDIVNIACKSCVMSLDSGAKLVVVPRFHPGAKPEDKKRWEDGIEFIFNGEYGEKYVGAVKSLQDTSDVKHSTDHLAMLADGVFAATGSALRAAAYAGKIPLCVWTPLLGEKLKAESGMEHHPLVSGDVMEHAGQEFTVHTDLIPTLWSRGDLIRANQKKFLAPVPFDAVKATNAILAVAK